MQSIHNLFTEPEVADLLRCSVATLRNWRRLRRGPAFIRAGRKVLYPVAALRDFLSTNATAQVPGSLECDRRGISRARLSEIECEHVSPTPDELDRIERSLEELTNARRRVLEVAAEVGWPL